MARSSAGSAGSAGGGPSPSGGVARSPMHAQAVPTTVVLHSGTAYAAGRLARQAAALAAHFGATPAPGPRASAQADAAGPEVGTAAGARACALALDIPEDEPVVVDVGTVDGRPGAVLVARSASGALTAYAVGASCGTAGSALVSGPVVIP